MMPSPRMRARSFLTLSTSSRRKSLLSRKLWQSNAHAFSRRWFLTGAGASALGASALVAGCSKDTPPDAAIQFDGPHQAGITTAQQDRMHFAAFNVVTNNREELAGLLQQWTSMARRMTRGETALAQDIDDVGQHSVPKDTGEAYDLRPANLTVTVGFGPSLFDDRFGLASAPPRRARGPAEIRWRHARRKALRRRHRRSGLFR